MHILLTNDDGIEAPGLVALARRIRVLGRVTVVAPETERSGISHAITLDGPLAWRRLPDDGPTVRHAVAGTPADCVKLAVTELAEGPVDLVVSGINPGSNAGVSVLYSGTVAAAMEAAMCGLPAAAVSIGEAYASAEQIPLGRAAEIAVGLIDELLRRGLLGRAPLNINIPPLRDGWPLGWRVTPQSVVAYDDRFEFDDEREAYRITRGDSRRETDGETDLALLARGYVTVTPLCFDLTDHDQLTALRAAARVQQREA